MPEAQNLSVSDAGLIATLRSASSSDRRVTWAKFDPSDAARSINGAALTMDFGNTAA